MDYFRIFFSAFFFENICSWHAIGLAIVILFSYSLFELFWMSLRIFFLVFFQSVLVVVFRPIFDFPGWELFLLPFLIGTMLLLSLFVDFVMPESKLGDTPLDFLKRGDLVVPMICALLIEKSYSPIETMVYGIGIVFGLIVLLLALTTMSIKFSFHRLKQQHIYMIKLFVLAILSLINL